MNIKSPKRKKKYEEVQKKTKEHIVETLPMIEEQKEEGVDEIQELLDEACTKARRRVENLDGQDKADEEKK